MGLCRKLRSFRNIYIMNHFIRYCTILPVISTKLAPRLLRWCGVKVGKNVFIGQGVYFDARDLSGFKYGMKFNEVDHIVKPVKLCNNCFVGMSALIMPGVTVGEGGGVASGAVVTKDVPPHTIVAGNPAKPIREYLPDGTNVRPAR